ncbi:MAG: CobD/CbiB family cobalamin biosynthesis protein [Synechococcaceae cyanobacterium]
MGRQRCRSSTDAPGAIGLAVPLSAAWLPLLAPLLAAGLDAAVGDPRRWPHPVQLMGAAIQFLRQPLEHWAGDRPRRLRLAGLLITVTLLAASLLAGLGLERLAAWGWRQGPSIGLISSLPLLLGLASALAGRSLEQAVRQVLELLPADSAHCPAQPRDALAGRPASDQPAAAPAGPAARTAGARLEASVGQNCELEVSAAPGRSPEASGEPGRELEPARQQLAWIVGRDTEALNEPEILRALAETASENAVDGLFAPLFWMLVGSALALVALSPAAGGVAPAAAPDGPRAERLAVPRARPLSLPGSRTLALPPSLPQGPHLAPPPSLPLPPLRSLPGALLPGPLSLAWGFKAASTLDSMLGYRRGRLRWLGTAGARLDDLLTWIPCRLVALTLPVAAGRPRQTWSLFRQAQKQGRPDPSPNAGVSQAAYALAANVRLGGVNHYGGEPRAKPLLAADQPAADRSAVERILALNRSLLRWWLLLWMLVGGALCWRLGRL